MNKVGRLVLIRHGETEWNESGKAQGLADNPLNSSGKAQAKATGRLVNSRFSPAKVWSSDLTRAMETAKMVSPHVKESRLLRELDLGEWDGRDWGALYTEHTELVTRFTRSDALFRPPGGESFNELFSRVSEFACREKLLELNGDAVVVAHAWVLASLISSLLGLKSSDACRFVLENGAFAVIEISGGVARLAESNISPTRNTKTSFPSQTRIVFIRHGETESNAVSMAQGIMDVPLNAKGESQAVSAGAFVRERFKPARVFSSDLKRAACTAIAVSSDVLLSRDIREIDIGDWSGVLWSELEDMYPADVARFRKAELKFRAPNGESFEDLLRRVTRFTRSAQLLTCGGDVVVVAHTWVLKAFFVCLLNFDPLSLSRFPFRNGGISVVEVSDGFTRLTLMNAGEGDLL